VTVTCDGVEGGPPISEGVGVEVDTPPISPAPKIN
jgi:hypothetical protein